jgi:hypothetical protein
MLLEIEQQSQGTATEIDTIMTYKESNTESFTEGFNNQQFKNDTRKDLQEGDTHILH